jgi:membrane protein YqaA with SNARE-associated domain
VLQVIEHLIVRYTAFIWTLLKPLGSWAVFAIAGIDSFFFGLPLDPVVAAYVYQDHSRFLLYALMAAAGSAAGCVILYVIGFQSGEVLLRNTMSTAKFEKIRSSFDRHEFWALMVPSMMPPPFPFKAFALAASVFEMNFWHFLLAIFVGRMVRFLLLSVLVVKFGPQTVDLASVALTKHWLAVLVFALLAGIAMFAWYKKRPYRTNT